jgi:hypothetical protein
MIGVTYTHTENIGDEFQIIGLMHTLSTIGVYPTFRVNRDTFDCPWASPPIGGKLVVNGWLAERRETIRRIYPCEYLSYISRINRPGLTFVDPQNLESRKIRTLYIGVHFNEDLLTDIANVRGLKEHFRSCGPIGARDLETLRRLEELGIDAYFSGCLTLNTIATGQSDFNGRYKIDVSDMEGTSDDEHSRALSQVVEDPSQESLQRVLSREALARERLNQLAFADSVISDRLHVYLPCLALGTPFSFFNPSFAETNERFSGLLSLSREDVRILRARQRSVLSSFLDSV